MASSDRPHYLPPLQVRQDAGEQDDDAAPGPLLRTASSSQSGGGVGLSRSTSAASRARSAHTGQASQAPRPPSAYSTTFTTSSAHHAGAPPPQTSSTHAGGIQPSASFFHPSRPTYYTDFGPMSNNLNVVPMTTVSRSASQRTDARTDPRPESGGSDSFAQTSFTTEEHTQTVTGRDRSGSASNPNVAGAVAGGVNHGFSMKKSREPLLPIGQKPKPMTSAVRPGVNASNSASKLSVIGSYGRWSEAFANKGEEGGLSSSLSAGRVRTSFEKFLRRTISNDTQMAQDTSYVKDPAQLESVEDLETRGRFSEDPSIEFKSSPNAMFEEEGTLNITRNRNLRAPSSLSRRQNSPILQPPFRDYNPIPPAQDPPLARTPIVDPSGRPIRKYELHRSQNTFFLKGRILTGGDSIWPFVCSVILVFGLAGIWICTTAVWWGENESSAVTITGVYMCLITIANMMVTAFSDPGILPRNLDPDPPYPQAASTEDAARVPLPRDLKVRSGVVRVKYCQTCRIYRPPRSSHCRMCDNCVDGCDHHCQWVNNCVGRRNYSSFILFLTSATLTLVLMIVTSALHISIHADRRHISAGDSLSDAAGSAMVFVLSVIVIWPVAGLLGYHVRLLLLNLTTIEQIRNSAHKSLVNGPAPPNPFSLGSWRHNLAETLCRSRGMSLLSAWEVATEDKRLPNPGAEIKD